jgi:hypothetical protein
MCILAPVRIFAVLCFEQVTSISVCEPEPVRNADFASRSTPFLSAKGDNLAGCLPDVLGAKARSPSAGSQVRNGVWKLDIDGDLIVAGMVETKRGQSTCLESWWRVRGCSNLITSEASTRFGEIQGCVCCEHKGATTKLWEPAKRRKFEAKIQDRNVQNPQPFCTEPQKKCGTNKFDRGLDELWCGAEGLCQRPARSVQKETEGASDWVSP